MLQNIAGFASDNCLIQNNKENCKIKNDNYTKYIIIIIIIIYSDNPLLRQFDDTLRTGLITILNVDCLLYTSPSPRD